MSKDRTSLSAEVIDFPARKKSGEKARKSDSKLNRNKDGSVRNISGKIYVDFYYLEERVRELPICRSLPP